MSPEDQIRQLVEDVENWRRGKKYPREKTPENIFNRAIELHLKYPNHGIMTKARMPSLRWETTLSKLRKQKKSGEVVATKTISNFIEIPHKNLGNIANNLESINTYSVEIVLPSGIKVRLR